ncbi:MAG: hypothetical protein IJS53_00550, partial [Clostridia bacterium]|nr:hypothetical protein [Clostridia bacterium]
MSTAVQRSRAARRGAKHLRSPLWEDAPALGRHAAEVFLFFFLCLSECFRLPSPFAACALSAFLLHKKRLFYPAVGVALSLGLRLLWQANADVWQYAGLALLLAFNSRPPRAVWMASAYTACALAIRLAAHILFPVTQEEMILSVLSLACGILCTPALCHAVGLAEEARMRLRIDDLLCCVVLGMLTLSGAGRVAVGPVNVGFLLSGLLVLLSAAAGGCAAAVCAGILGGVSLALCGHADGYVVCFAFSGIVCGLFYGRKRPVLCLIHLLCVLFTSYAVRSRLDVTFLITAGLSCLVFLLLPRRVITGLFTLLRRLSPDDADNEAAYAQSTRAQWVGSIDALSRLLPEVRLQTPEPQEQVEDVMARLCEGCERLPICWSDKREETKAMFQRYFTENDLSARME